MNCIHGLDARFCATCNRQDKSKSRTAVGNISLEEILTFLNDEQVRATYGAVAEVLGVVPRAMATLLGHLGVLPAGQREEIMHPPVKNVAGLLVGEMRPAKSWLG